MGAEVVGGGGIEAMTEAEAAAKGGGERAWRCMTTRRVVRVMDGGVDRMAAAQQEGRRRSRACVRRLRPALASGALVRHQ